MSTEDVPPFVIHLKRVEHPEVRPGYPVTVNRQPGTVVERRVHTAKVQVEDQSFWLPVTAVIGQ